MGVQVQRSTRSFTPSTVERRWLVVDATDQVLGRLAARVAAILRGKHRATYTPHADTGDFVIVINAEKVKLTGRKREQIRSAVRGMLPHNALGRALFRKLKVYSGPDHPHAAQKPEELSLA